MASSKRPREEEEDKGKEDILCGNCGTAIAILFCSGECDRKGCTQARCNDCIEPEFQACSDCGCGVCTLHSVVCSACEDWYCLTCQDCEHCEQCCEPLCGNCTAAGLVCQCTQGDGSKDNPIDLGSESEEDVRSDLRCSSSAVAEDELGELGEESEDDEVISAAAGEAV